MSPYGWTKFVSEQIIQNCASQLNISFISLRYFNVIGNDDFPMAFDNSEECLVPKIYKAIINKELPKVFGTDFDTSDGTAIRDYIDVRDLSHIHFLAAKHLMESKKNLNKFFNVGSGKPVSVLEIINSFSKLLDRKIMYEDVGRILLILTRFGQIMKSFLGISAGNQNIVLIPLLNLFYRVQKKNMNWINYLIQDHDI